MITPEQPKFAEVVSEALAQYAKRPTAADIEDWWVTCKRFSLADVERGLREHSDHEEDGKRAPRPIDVKRRLQYGTRETSGCSATGVSGRCAYPGIFSESTGGGEQWWCPWHRSDRGGPEAERWIQVSLEVPYEKAMAKRSARMVEEAQRTRVVVNTSHAIALRHGNRPWQPRGAPPVVTMPFNEDAEDAA